MSESVFSAIHVGFNEVGFNEVGLIEVDSSAKLNIE